MKKWIGIIIGVIAVLAVTVIVLFNFTNIFQANEDEALNEYVSNFEEGSYEEIYENLSAEHREEYSAEDVTERYEKFYEDLGVEPPVTEE